MGKPQDYRKILIKSISTFFFIGYLPLAPGTFGSLAGVGIFFLFKGHDAGLVSVTLILIILGFFFNQKAEKIFNKKDPPCVVIDEVAGMLLGLLFLPYYDIKVITIAFLFFRILDTFKPYPVGRIERLKGSTGIMGDDLMAGLYTNIILQLVLRLASFKAS